MKMDTNPDNYTFDFSPNLRDIRTPKRKLFHEEFLSKCEDELFMYKRHDRGCCAFGKIRRRHLRRDTIKRTVQIPIFIFDDSKEEREQYFSNEWLKGNKYYHGSIDYKGE